MFTNKLDLDNCFRKLEASGKETQKFFEHGSLEVELYKPNQIDKQQPHERDEVYVIVSGKGDFVLDGKTTSVGKGDVLFVPARTEHRFISFSEDFATWVFFYGPPEGEQDTALNFLLG